MNRYGYIDERKDLVIFRRQHSDIVKERIRETESKEVIDRNAKKLTYGLLDFIASLKPRDYSSYIDGSLRRLSKWDEQENLTIFIQFDPDFDKIDLLSVVSGSN
ncbi:MAG: hypothetical protein ABIQ93_13675 [Saprospiraceae bacterium]